MPGSSALLAVVLLAPGVVARAAPVADASPDVLVVLASDADHPETTAPQTPTPVARGVTISSQPGNIASGPVASITGASDYAITAQDIADLPIGDVAPLTDVLAQAPGVAIDQNQQIHIRNTEGPQFQYQINGVLVPLDINTNPPFISMLNPQFIARLDLLDGVLPSRYSYATGGVVDIQTKDGCTAPGGDVAVLAGQREILQPSFQLGGCQDRFSYYVSGLYAQGETAFSSATPGPEPIHDHTYQGQAFGYFTYQLDDKNALSLALSTAASNNQLPNQPDLAPLYVLKGVSDFPSADIDSHLNFRDSLAILKLSGGESDGLTYQVAYAFHYLSEAFRPDNAGELIYQGVASRATHTDVDNTLQADVTDRIGRHQLSAGLYVGNYDVSVDDRSLVFPILLDFAPIRPAAEREPSGSQLPPPPPGEPPGPPVQASTTPFAIISDTSANNLLAGLYVDDLWQATARLDVDLGLRVDYLTGFTTHTQLDPSINLSYRLTDAATLHGGFGRYMQVPSFQGISPTANSAFALTTAALTPGGPTPQTEDDYEWDVGAVAQISQRLRVSQDNYFVWTKRYLDTGQFGVVPLFAPFNYDHGYIWGSELALSYRGERLAAYANLTVGQNWQKGVDTGQFNFDLSELAVIDKRGFQLDHQPLAGGSLGGSYRWGPYELTLDGVFSSGLHGGFADHETLPYVAQLNAAVQRSFELPRVGRLIERLSILNVADRVNQIRAAEGIGIFQAAYGPRFTVLNSVTLAF